MMQIAQARHHRDRVRASHGVMLSGSKDWETEKNRELQQSTTSPQQCHTDLLKCTNRTNQW
jgi:hypothetical protein